MQYNVNKNPINQARGYINKSTGEAFEKIILAACEVYKAKRLAFVDKTPEPFRPVSGIHQKGRMMVFDCVAAKKAQPDFKGTIGGGRAICFEAKTSDSDRIDQSVVTHEQAEDLNLHTLLGAATYVFVSLQLRDFYRVPWSVWQDMKQLYGRKYMTKDDLAPYKINFKNGVLELFKEEDL